MAKHEEYEADDIRVDEIDRAFQDDEEEAPIKSRSADLNPGHRSSSGKKTNSLDMFVSLLEKTLSEDTGKEAVFTSEYVIHPEARESAPGLNGIFEERDLSPAGENLYIDLTMAIYSAIRRTTAADIQEKLGEGYAKSIQEAMAKLVATDLVRDPGLREAASAFARSDWNLPDTEKVRGLNLRYMVRHGELETVSVKVKIADSTGERRDRYRELDLLTAQDCREWAQIMNLATEAIMDGRSPDDTLLKENDDGRSSLYSRASFSASELSKETERQNTESIAPKSGVKEENSEKKREANVAKTGGKDRKVHFNVIDHSGKMQSVYTKVDMENCSINLYKNEIVDQNSLRNFELRFPGASTPIYTTANLFLPRESMYLPKAFCEKVADATASLMTLDMNRYFSSDQENKLTTVSLPKTAEEIKTKILDKAMPDGTESRQDMENALRSNSVDGGNLLSVLRMRPADARWTPSFVMVSTSNRADSKDRLPVIYIEGVGPKGEQTLSHCVTVYGLNYHYDQVKNVFSLWKSESPIVKPLVEDWRATSPPSAGDFNQMLMLLMDIREQTEKSGRSIDGKTSSKAELQGNWIRVQTLLKPEQETGDRIDIAANESLARSYIRCMGLGLERNGRIDKESFPLHYLQGHKLGLFATSLVCSKEIVPFLKIGQVTESEFNEVEKKLELCDLTYSYNRSDQVLFVAYSPNGRPGFERVDRYYAPDIQSLDEKFRETAAHTIAAYEAKHIAEDGFRDLKSDTIRAGIYEGYIGLLSATGSIDMTSAKGGSIRKELLKHPEKYLFTFAYEKEITKGRNRILSGQNAVSKVLNQVAERVAIRE